MKKLGMHSLLGVGQGSINESFLVTIEWKGNKKSKEKPIAFVGKGVCFDTGGISLKPAKFMEEMKYDRYFEKTISNMQEVIARGGKVILITNENNKALLKADGLVKHFPITRGIFRREVGSVNAVDGISFEIQERETLGLVGESGCGKSTAARVILQLIPATAGNVFFKGRDLTSLDKEELRKQRQHMQMIFQDPQDSLNPRMTVGSIIREPLMEHKKLQAEERSQRVEQMLISVGMNPKFTNRYPHEFSGGQRQRIGIARALALSPEFIICDEPIAALDVSIQAQVINLLEDLQEEFGLTYLFISHDLSMIRHIADRVAVMYLGRIVELASSQALYSAPLHPYTQALLSAVPMHDPKMERKRKRTILVGDVPSPANPPSGCNFSTRCPRAEDRCFKDSPEWREVFQGHQVACHLV